MATPKYVYFANDEKWFNTERECLAYEKEQEIINYILDSPGTKFYLDRDQAESVAKTLLFRYEIKERWDYNKIKEVVTDSTDVTNIMEA